MGLSRVQSNVLSCSAILAFHLIDWLNRPHRLVFSCQIITTARPSLMQMIAAHIIALAHICVVSPLP